MVGVRPAAATDAAAIAELMTQLGYPCSADDAVGRLGYWLGDPASSVLVAEWDDAVIGCLSLHAVPYLERTGRWARIESLVIAESARGAGAGAALVRAAERQARRWGCLAMEVTSARARRGAHAFYERMGFTDICSRSGRFLKELG
jgi:GNAT superfamily N-acetyltransferase